MKYYNFLTNNEVNVNTKLYDFNMEIAEKLSTRSKDENTKVGCVITDKDSVIVSSGYNGPNRHAFDSCYNFTTTDKYVVLAAQYKHLDLPNRSIVLKKNPFMIHAEMNAILQCAKFGVQTDDAEIYVTHFPCLKCTQSIIQAGIRKIYYLHDYHNHPYAKQLLKQANIETIKGEIPSDFFEQIIQLNERNLSKESE